METTDEGKPVVNETGDAPQGDEAWKHDLKQIAARLGRVPTHRDLLELDCYIPVYKRYGGLKKGLLEEGLLEEQVDLQKVRAELEGVANWKYNLREIVKRLGRKPTCRDLYALGCYNEIQTSYGGLKLGLLTEKLDRKAIKELTAERVNVVVREDEEGEKGRLREIAARLGRVPSRKDLMELGCYHEIYKRYGGYREALKAEGLRYTRTQLPDLKAVAAKLGRIPLKKDLLKMGCYQRIYHRYGGLKNALVEQGLGGRDEEKMQEQRKVVQERILGGENLDEIVNGTGLDRNVVLAGMRALGYSTLGRLKREMELHSVALYLSRDLYQYKMLVHCEGKEGILEVTLNRSARELSRLLYRRFPQLKGKAYPVWGFISVKGIEWVSPQFGEALRKHVLCERGNHLCLKMMPLVKGAERPADLLFECYAKTRAEGNGKEQRHPVEPAMVIRHEAVPEEMRVAERGREKMLPATQPLKRKRVNRKNQKPNNMKNRKTKEETVNELRATGACLNANANIISAVPALAAAAERLQGLLKGMEEMPEASVSENATKVMKEEWKALSEYAQSCLAGLNIFAEAAGNEELKWKTALPRYEFLQLKKEDVATACEGVAALARLHLGEAAAYGLCAENVERLEAAVKRFSEAVCRQEEALRERVEMNALFEVRIKEIKELVTNQVDRMVFPLKEREPAFVKEYFRARNIKRHRKLGRVAEVLGLWVEVRKPRKAAAVVAGKE